MARKIYTDKNFRCSKCGGQLEVEDIFDNEVCSDKYVEHGYGFCTQCGQYNKIDIVYKFIYYEVEEGEN